MAEPDFAAAPPPPDLRGASFGHDVTEYLRHLILIGQLRPGDRLRVEHLAARFRISVTPIREALVELASEGFVERRPRRGYVVSKLTRSGFEDRVLVLGMVLGELAARATPVLDDAQLDRLDALQADLLRAESEGARDAAEEHSRNLHRTINLAASSPELAWTAERFSRYVPRYRGMPADTRPRSCTYEHAAVLDALRRRDAEAARQAMQEHLVASARQLGDELASTGVWGE
ncbi:GntR family transcriptional regulator [Pseudonocardia kujensis]|uniref:GntR family transcriptional regulator n=1 Tax=Pseudonocardia kujensis TaxID=1128675 RepID=UPI001E4A1FF6|nr:GntR family transcriptional regulator [Pseudonocardia kujensis]MCE0764097.1 GntR family transcriptional regulator [Pseudonocardia kujensis]